MKPSKSYRMICFAFIVLAVVFLYSRINEKYMEKKRAYYQEKINDVRLRMLEEKDWIKKNQGEGGEIYLNYNGNPLGAGDVNPYFACLAAQGLLAGTPSKEDMDAVKKYLLWHREHFLESQGIVENYRLKEGSLVSTGKYDSVDSYVAVFLSLLCQYGLRGGDVASIDMDNEVLSIATDRLRELTENGLVRIKPDREVFYLMDNIEVLAAYRDAAVFVAASGAEPWLLDKQELWSRYLEAVSREMEEAIRASLWNEQEKRFHIGLGSGKTPLDFADWNVLYPDAVAQIYPAAFGISLSGADNTMLYEKLCSSIDWENMNFGEGEEFCWGILAYTAALLEDAERAETYLSQYEKKTKESRAYPLHTADSGWVAKACAELELFYKKKMESSLLTDFLSIRG